MTLSFPQNDNVLLYKFLLKTNFLLSLIRFFTQEGFGGERSCWNKNVRNVFKTFYTNLFKMLGLKVTKLDPDKYTHIFYFFLFFFLPCCVEIL